MKEKTFSFPRQHEAEVRAWEAPNYAAPADELLDSIPVRDLPDDVLYKMANHWLDELYRKAGRPRPPKATP